MLYNVASCWLYLKEYINDARSHERQMPRKSARESELWKFYTAVSKARTLPFLLFLWTDAYLIMADVGSRNMKQC
jgi:hypothetical protein